MDTYLKGKNLSSYHRTGIGDVSILLSRTLASWAQTIQISASRFLLWTSLAVDVAPVDAHAHGGA